MSDEEPVGVKKPFKMKLSDIKSSEPGDLTVHIEQARAAAEAFNSVQMPGPADRLMQQMEEQQRRINDIVKPSPGVQRAMDEMEKHRRNMEASLGSLGGMHKIYNDLEEQRKRIKTMGMPRDYPSEVEIKPLQIPTIPPNPILKTNKKLEDIEAKFEQMLDVMSGAANIANDIQAHAAHFLEKFDKASEQTDRSARGAVRVAVIAMVISVVTPFIPMAIGYVWPDDTPVRLESLARQIIDRQAVDRASTDSLLKELSESNLESANRVADALRQRDEQMTQMLEDIRTIANHSQETSSR